MDKLGIKATIYDILGYVIPGAFFCVGYYLLTIDIGKLDFSGFLKVEISGAFGIVATLTFYVTGHLLSSISSFIFENNFSTCIASKFYDFDTGRYDDAAIKVFGKKYNECGPRTAVVFCQTKYPVAYEAAFNFLTIYGLSRNISVCMLLLFPLFLTKFTTLGSGVLYVISFGFMVRNYFRFRVYFIHQIASSLMIP